MLPLLALAASAVVAISPVRAQPADEVVALVGGEVRVGDGRMLRDATVIIRDGRIEAVGKDVEVPGGARTIDCTGKVVTPGLIDADSALGMSSADLSGRVTGADVRAVDAFDPWDARLRTALRQGVTTLHLGANRTQLVGGVSAVVPAGPPGAPAIDADGALALNVSTSSSSSGIAGAARVASLRATLIGVRHRESELDRWRRDLAKYETKRPGDGPLPEEKLLLPPELLERMRLWSPGERAAWREAAYKSMGRSKKYTKPKKPAAPPKTPRDDPSADVVAEAVSIDGADAGRRAFLRAELAADVDGALGAIEDFGLDATIVGGEGLRSRRKALAKAGVPVVVSRVASASWSRSSSLARRDEGLTANLVEAGLRPAVASGAAGGSRFLRLLVAHEIGEGLNSRVALSTVTLWAAQAVGVGEDTGSLEKGKRADVVVWSGDPFDAATRTEHVFVAGEEVDVDGD